MDTRSATSGAKLKLNGRATPEDNQYAFRLQEEFHSDDIGDVPPMASFTVRCFLTFCLLIFIMLVIAKIIISEHNNWFSTDSISHFNHHRL